MLGEAGGNVKAPFDPFINASLLWQAEEKRGHATGKLSGDSEEGERSFRGSRSKTRVCQPAMKCTREDQEGQLLTGVVEMKSFEQCCY